MRINKVKLNNYRCHRDAEFAFQSGVNLLIGSNGAGKSSILEAIGLALFDSDIRDSLKEAITREEKSAQITVEIEGNDGLDYRIERKLGAGQYYRIYKIDEDSPRLEGKQNVVDKVCELAGIESNAANIYKDVITAYQNKITDIFSQTPKMREISFNQIFDTAAYRQMYEGYLKEIEDDYKKKSEFCRLTLSDLEAKIIDEKELADKESKLADLKNDLQAKVDSLKKLIQEQELEKSKFDVLKQNIEKTSHSLIAKNELKKARENELVSVKNYIDESKKAIAILEENKSGYDRYNEVTDELSTISKKVKELELNREQFLLNERKIAESNQQIEKLAQQVISAENEIAEKSLALDGLNIDSTALSNELDTIHSELSAISAELSSYQSLSDKVNSCIADYNKFFANLDKLNQEIEIKKSGLIDTFSITIELEEQKEIAALLTTKKNDKESTIAMQKQIEARLNDNIEAGNILSEGLCPYLKENCKNVLSGSSAADYFNLKAQSLNQELAIISEKLKDFQNLDLEISENYQKLTLLMKQLTDNEKSLKEIEIFLHKTELIKKEIELSEMKIAVALDPIADRVQSFILTRDFDGIKEFISGIISELKAKIQTESALSSDKEKNILKLNSEISKLYKLIEKRNFEKISLEKQLGNLKIEIDEINIENNNISNIIEELPELKKNEDIKKLLLADLQESYRLYIANRNKAGELQTHLNKFDEISKDIELLSVELQNLENQKIELEKSYSQVLHSQIIAEITSGKSNLEFFASQLSESNKEIALIQREIAENRQLIKTRNVEKSKLSLLQKKIGLTSVFRDNVNNMGKHVATRLLERIEIAATDNYRRISGRGEAVRWLNDDKNSYQVYLVSGDNWNASRKFEMLSGGEQVTVALALRAATASIMTKANFAIFDEPTINLDAERRIALADSLRAILKSLEQAIIVTHDDSFREISQQVIEL